MTSTPALILENVLLARQATDAALLNFQLMSKDKVLVLGSNGCGKTTLVESIAGHLSIVSGEVGRGARLGYVTQQPLLPLSLTVKQYLKQLESVCSDELANNAEACISLFNLSQHAHQRISKLSRGWQQRVNLAQAWLGNPNLIILDEPQTALDPDGMQLLRSAIQKSEAAVVVFAPPQTGCESLIDNHLNFSQLC